MSTSLRRSAAAACLALPLLLTACAGTDAPSPSSDAAAPAATPAAPAPSAPPTAAPTAASAAATPAPTAADDGVETVSITVSGDAVSGDTGRVPVPLGSRVAVTVTADVVDEVHVHGYDLHADTVVGQPATVEFVADQPGVFEVELEEARVLLTRLQVQ